MENATAFLYDCGFKLVGSRLSPKDESGCRWKCSETNDEPPGRTAGTPPSTKNSGVTRQDADSERNGCGNSRGDRPFCEPDPNCFDNPPTYVNTTLQLDSPGLGLHYAKQWDFVDRFKLRVRTYGDPVGEFPVFMEVKGKDRNTILKQRCQIPFAQWGEHLFRNEIIKDIQFKTAKEADNFYQFIRLAKQIGARPVMLIRYRRESYFGKIDSYSRVTFDTELQYQQTYSWNSWGADGGWRALDNPMMQTRRHDRELHFWGVVLELKALHDVPRWMLDVVTKLDLWRQGHCKYSNAIWAESMFRATPWTPEYEIDLLPYL